MTAASTPGNGRLRLAILGATGGIGGHVLNWAADAGYPVHVLARRPGAVPRRSGVTVTEGDATDPLAVADAVASADAVLSALGPRGAKTPHLLPTAAMVLTQAMAKTGPARLICVSAAGAFIREDAAASPVVKAILPRIFARSFADVRAMEEVIRASALDWTLVRPTRLVGTPARGEYRIRPDYPPPGLTKVARADVAAFMIRAMLDASYVRESPAICW
ncbi:MAG TPA: NAD(P)H-binding protein [Streptosporangiaceae bacterium]|nr:NAD(P)H-binding protein [Streptosporangiaceae bacterium]